ncbi:serine hydrolase [Streptococcus pluranimalium]
MKKWFPIVFVCLLLTFTTKVTSIEVSGDIVKVAKEAGYEVNPQNAPKSSIVIDAESGDILWEDQIDLERDPASLSKLMTLYLFYEHMAEKGLSLTDTITATPSDEAISQLYEISNNNLVAGVAYPIKDLIIATLVPSSNASTIVLANYLSQNDADAFIRKMNQTAKELGMTHTRFYNASGAVARAFQGYYQPKDYDPEAHNITTAKDLAILVYHFLKKYPDVLSYTKTPEISIMTGTPYQETFTAYNHSLPGSDYAFTGVDGLKTGSSPSAAFNGIVTAKQGDTRLITVVMGVGDWMDQNGEYYRHPFINGLLAKGFKDHPQYLKAKKEGTEFKTVLNQKTEVSKRVTKAVTKPKKNSSHNRFNYFLVIIIILMTSLMLTLIAYLIFLKR